MPAIKNFSPAVVLAPVLVDQSAANTVGAAVDMQGYDRVVFIYQLGAMVNGASLSSWASESSESNMGNATNITDGALVNVTNTYNNTIQILDIFRPSKRYVSVNVDAVAANITLLGVSALRFRGTGTNPPTATTGWQHVTVRAD